jgi:aspartyl protease family protein
MFPIPKLALARADCGGFPITVEPLSLLRLLFLAGVLGIAAYQVPKFAPGLVERLAGGPQSAPQADQSSGPARIIEVAPPVASVPPPAPEEPRAPRKIAGGNSSGGGGITLQAGPSGHYSAEVRINGARVDMMVDTGATVISLSQETARRLSIFPLPEAYTATMHTANGVVFAAPVMLAEVRLGNISVRQVQAVVMPAKVLGTDLLGMSFLGRLSRFTVGNNEMVLRQ